MRVVDGYYQHEPPEDWEEFPPRKLPEPRRVEHDYVEKGVGFGPRHMHDHSGEQPPHFLFHRARLAVIFLVTQTLVFPLEHLAWEKAPLLRDVTAWMGL